MAKKSTIIERYFAPRNGLTDLWLAGPVAFRGLFEPLLGLKQSELKRKALPGTRSARLALRDRAMPRVIGMGSHARYDGLDDALPLPGRAWKAVRPGSNTRAPAVHSA